MRYIGLLFFCSLIVLISGCSMPFDGFITNSLNETIIVTFSPTEGYENYLLSNKEASFKMHYSSENRDQYTSSIKKKYKEYLKGENVLESKKVYEIEIEPGQTVKALNFYNGNIRVILNCLGVQVRTTSGVLISSDKILNMERNHFFKRGVVNIFLDNEMM